MAGKLAGTEVLITAGPTYEFLDDVRYLGNPSTGRMGIELAEAARAKGAIVTLVIGPTHLRRAHVTDRTGRRSPCAAVAGSAVVAPCR